MSSNSNLNHFNPFYLKDVKRNASRNLFTVVSTFAGGGGSSTGYKLAGGNIKLANEFIPAAVETYRTNYPETPIVPMDLRKITRRGGREYVLDFFNDYGVELGKLDILDGSPPCTTFSKATGGRGAEKIEKNNVEHSDTTQSRIGMLMHDYVYLVNCLKPKTFVMENVTPSKDSFVFKDGIKRLRNRGYIVAWQSLFSSDYGVPQKRERLITIGIHRDIAKALGITTSEGMSDLFPSKISKPITVKQALEGIELSPEEEDMLLDSCRRNSSYEILKHIPKNPKKTMRIDQVYPEWKESINSDFTLFRASWNEPVPTLTCRGQQLGIGGIHHPSQDRKFSISELKRLMSLPDDYILKGSFNQKAERIGNMVPPLMTKAIASSIYEKILKPTKNIEIIPDNDD